MTRFAHVLQRAELTLRAPEPQRSRVLLELAQDLDDLFAELRGSGLTEDEAARRAESLLAPSAEALAALAAVHAPMHVRLAERFAPGGPHRVERAVLVFVSVVSLAIAGSALFGTSAFASGSPVLWVQSVLLACTAWQGAALLLQVPAAEWNGSGRMGRKSDGVASRMAVLLWLGAVAGVAGVIGATVEVWRMAVAAEAGAVGAAAMFAYVGRAADVLTFTLALLLATLLVWFLAYRRARYAATFRRQIEREEEAS